MLYLCKCATTFFLMILLSVLHYVQYIPRAATLTLNNQKIKNNKKYTKQKEIAVTFLHKACENQKLTSKYTKPLRTKRVIRLLFDRENLRSVYKKYFGIKVYGYRVRYNGMKKRLRSYIL